MLSGLCSCSCVRAPLSRTPLPPGAQPGHPGRQITTWWWRRDEAGGRDLECGTWRAGAGGRPASGFDRKVPLEVRGPSLTTPKRLPGGGDAWEGGRRLERGSWRRRFGLVVHSNEVHLRAMRWTAEVHCTAPQLMCMGGREEAGRELEAPGCSQGPVEGGGDDRR